MERNKRQGPYPYYGASGIIDYIDDYIFDGTYLLVAEDGENLRSRKTPIAFFASGKFWVNNHAHILLAKKGIADDYFIKAWFDQANISGYITGAAQPKLSQANLKRIKLLLPPLATQRKIAAILSAYDDLIENNTRRIQILEEMAQTIYREWFVHFRFPGHEDVQMVDSGTELGEVPEGWEVTTLGDIAEVNSESIRKGSEPDEILYVNISSVSTGNIDLIEPLIYKDAPSRARRIVRHGDVIWSSVRPNRKSYSLIIDPPKNLIVSTGFAVIRASKTPYTYLYLAVTTEKFVEYLTNHATGAAYPAVNAGDFENAVMLFPQAEILERFHGIVERLYLLKQNLLLKNIQLRMCRDLLLPKLVSGEIEVSGLEVPS